MNLRMSVAPICMAGMIAALLATGFASEALAQAKDKAKTAPAAKSQPAAKGESEEPARQISAVATPWTKMCGKDQQENKEICEVSQSLRLETGQFLASVAVREIKGDQNRKFIIVVPPGLLLQPGLRVVIDKIQPIPAKYSICFTNVCFGDIEITTELIGHLKKGQVLTVQAINQAGRTWNATFDLREFGKAYDGPAIDPKVVEEQQKKLHEELQKRAEEARKQLEGQKK